MSQHQQDQTTAPGFAVQRLYIKDLSFEAPQVPAIFQEQWPSDPDLKIQLHVNSAILSDGLYEVVLQITASVAVQAKTLFLVEVQQAGIFSLQGFTAEQLPPILNVTCPTILFPYVREVVSDLVVRATFPPLYLAPVNFEAMYLANSQQTTMPDSEASIIIKH